MQQVIPQAGKNARFVVESRQTVSSIVWLPLVTSIMPAAAFGARLEDNEGFLKSQSTTITLFPPCPMSCAREAAIVVLPSLGRADVIPMTWFEVLVALRSIASLIERIASANLDSGLSMTARWTAESLEIIR